MNDKPIDIRDPALALPPNIGDALTDKVMAFALANKGFAETVDLWYRSEPGPIRDMILADVVELLAIARTAPSNLDNVNVRDELIAAQRVHIETRKKLEVVEGQIIEEMRLQLVELNRRHAWLLERFAGITLCEPHELTKYIGDSFRQYAELVDPGKPSPSEESDDGRGVAGDRCEVGNECGRAGCPECQQ
jgi:hypothetical protein